ncbi:MAG: hypothetical protein SPL15_06330 [Lachnospiraceae bacterium]|nr:hypothetical protein [Lachnospiraceae bacterium]MDY5742592.1 hypothetical protein [Lachnospiraceae bacterium]
MAEVSRHSSQSVNYQCPACTGPLHFVGASGQLECDYCGSAFAVEEVEKLYREKEERAAKAKALADESEWKTAGEETTDWGEGTEGMKSYNCPSCGAEMICDANTAASCCPYCGNQTVIPGQFSGSLKPEFVVPFKTDKEQAKTALERHYKGKILLPKSFASSNHIEEIQGVYVPFWMFDGTAEGAVTFHATQSRQYQQGDVEVTETEHYDVFREGSLAFEKVPVDASSRMPDGHMDSIEPFDYNELKPFSMAYMPGFLADRYDVEAKDCSGRMEERCSETLEQALSDTVTGYDTKTLCERNIHVHRGEAHYAMLPVWLLATKWQDQSFLFAMNGQTGKLVGDLPVDKAKYWSIFSAVTVVAALLSFVTNTFVLSDPLTGWKMLLLYVGLPLLLAFGVGAGLLAQMKSIHTQNAAAYVGPEGLELRHQEDVYIRTTIHEQVISRDDADQMDI